jgi:hypothetical protein
MVNLRKSASVKDTSDMWGLMMRRRGFGSVGWLIFLMLCSPLIAERGMAAGQVSPMVIIHGDLPPERSPKNAYRAELYKLLLDATRAEFGDYQIQTYTASVAPRRQAILISAGNQLNVHWATPGTPIAKSKVIKIPVDIQQGLLGYRVCLTSSQTSASWAAALDLKSLALIRIGQVDSWPDDDIYKFNHFNLVRTPSFDGLFQMLAANRFDCLALGVDEVGTVYRDKKAQYTSLQIEPSILLHYEFPVYFYVSATRPDIARRFLRGFEIIQQNGQFKALFNRYFTQDLVALNLPARRIICLKSPYVGLAGQCQHPRVFPAILRP